MANNRTVVHVAGQEFHLSGPESEEYIQKIAIYVDKRVDELQELYPNLSASQCAIFAAISMSDELHKLRDAYEELEGQMFKLGEARSTPATPVRHPFEKKPVTTN